MWAQRKYYERLFATYFHPEYMRKYNKNNIYEYIYIYPACLGAGFPVVIVA